MTFSFGGVTVSITWDHRANALPFSAHGYNVSGSTNVRYQRQEINSWGAPTMDFAVVIPAKKDD